jgi:hypothetical protein
MGWKLPFLKLICTVIDLLQFRGNFDWPNYCYSAIFSVCSVARVCGQLFLSTPIFPLRMYRGFPIKFRGWGPIKNFFNNWGNLNFRCVGERQVSYIPIDQKFIGVVSTETEIWFFEKKKIVAKKLRKNCKKVLKLHLFFKIIF